ncbi:MAG: hypothetical protein K2N63_05060 [Lachnospiraceae bacterium]|nr:hypothetical protein [Lachnospiraceae bacterium]
MSLVLGYCDGTTGIIASDGRAGGTVCPSEEYNKTRVINKNIILGFVGYKESCEYFLDCANKCMGSNIEDYYIDDYLEVVEFGMNKKSTQEHLQSTFMIMGKTKTGEIKFVITGQDTGYKTKFLPTQGNLAFIGGTISISKIREICEYNSAMKVGKIMNVMIRIIRDVAKLDNSVNTTCYFIFL